MCKVSMPHKALRSTRLLISWAKRLAAGSHSKNPGLGPWAHAIPRDGSHRHRLVTNGRVTAPQADPSDGSWLPGLPRRRALTPCPLPGSSSFGHSVRAPPAGSGAGCAGGTHASFGRFHSRFGDRSALPRLLNSDIDVDRADFLLRDAFQCGVAYGRYDVAWLISTCTLGQTAADRWVVGWDRRKALSIVEQLLIAREALYHTAYWHKTVVSAEVMVGRFLRPYRATTDI